MRTFRSWNKFQRDSFIDAFARFMVATYASRFVGTTGQSFEIEGSEEAPSGRMIVHSRHQQSENPAVPIDYLVQPADDGWRILNVYLDKTISLLALHRSEFSSVLRDRGSTASSRPCMRRSTNWRHGRTAVDRHTGQSSKERNKSAFAGPASRSPRSIRPAISTSAILTGTAPPSRSPSLTTSPLMSSTSARRPLSQS